MCSSSSFTSSFRFKPFISLPPFLSFFRFNSSFLFVLRFLSFQLVHFIVSYCVRPFVATLPFHSLLPSFRFNSFSSLSLLLPFPFNSSLPFPIRRAFRFKSF
jgi:hypothetical protein